MRVVVRIPEREIPYVHVGDKAEIEFDALPDRRFEAAISRIAHGEESHTRTMIAEIDLPNKDDLLRDHMYGRVDIELEKAPDGVSIPSACLVGNVTDGKARAFVVEEGKARLRDIQVGKDTGKTVEVFSGLSEADEVIVRPPGGLADGAEVAAERSGGSAATGKIASPRKPHGGSAR
jgi:multidrug efflux pump subunit AcrA (membrane-fusion protein)